MVATRGEGAGPRAAGMVVDDGGRPVTDDGGRPTFRAGDGALVLDDAGTPALEPATATGTDAPPATSPPPYVADDEK